MRRHGGIGQTNLQILRHHAPFVLSQFRAVLNLNSLFHLRNFWFIRFSLPSIPRVTNPTSVQLTTLQNALVTISACLWSRFD
jgi:hypothetical protein